MPVTTFHCDRCGLDKTHDANHTTGYGVMPDGQKHCFACCGETDAELMASMVDAMRQGLKVQPLCLYLSRQPDGSHSVTNWPGTLTIRPTHVSKGCHNIARWRYDVWFNANGAEWHGVQYGDNTQIVHCKPLRKKR